MALDGDAIVRELIARRCAAGCLTPPACFVVAFLPPHLRQALLAYVLATPRRMRETGISVACWFAAAPAALAATPLGCCEWQSRQSKRG